MRYRVLAIGLLAVCLCSCAHTGAALLIPHKAVRHVDRLVAYRGGGGKALPMVWEDVVSLYRKSGAWLSLSKPQIEAVLRMHGFGPSFRYIPVDKKAWGEGYDEALCFEMFVNDLWILFSDGKVAAVGTILEK